MLEALKGQIKELLKAKKVELVIGYQRANDGIAAIPYFMEKASEAENLIWDAYCVYNLSKYLLEFPDKKKGIIAKPCDLKSLIVLLQENQLKREELFIIAVECKGVADEKKNNAQGFPMKCKDCDLKIPKLYDVLIEDKEKKAKLETGYDEYEAIRKLEAKSIEERQRLWEEEFLRCIRCYACRQICPMCYCPRCVAEQTMPAWFSKAGNLPGNLSWNVTRAMHLAGRCVDCGECERACPVGLPLRDIHKKIEKDVRELFNYEAASDIAQKPLFSSFDKNDPDAFIR
ncbi:MAG: 4Fe-4S dicluster domain-containing protein [Candidatus Omnitrophota bacterium]